MFRGLFTSWIVSIQDDKTLKRWIFRRVAAGIQSSSKSLPTRDSIVLDAF
jgi:hypothetical protein